MEIGEVEVNELAVADRVSERSKVGICTCPRSKNDQVKSLHLSILEL